MCITGMGARKFRMVSTAIVTPRTNNDWQRRLFSMAFSEILTFAGCGFLCKISVFIYVIETYFFDVSLVIYWWKFVNAWILHTNCPMLPACWTIANVRIIQKARCLVRVQMDNCGSWNSSYETLLLRTSPKLESCDNVMLCGSSTRNAWRWGLTIRYCCCELLAQIGVHWWYNSRRRELYCFVAANECLWESKNQRTSTEIGTIHDYLCLFPDIVAGSGTILVFALFAVVMSPETFQKASWHYVYSAGIQIKV